MYKHLTFAFCAIFLLMFGLSSCSDDNDVTVNDEESWEVMAILPHYGLGDIGYYDDMYLGLSQLRDSLGCKVYVNDVWFDDEAESMAQEWLNRQVGKNQHRLLVLGDGSYADFVKSNGWQNTPNTSILLMDTDEDLPVYTRSLLLYGVCYLAGKYSKDVERITGKGTALIVANNTDWAINQGAAGFIDGAKSQGIEVKKHIMYEHEYSRGYQSADSVYHLCYEIAPTTGFVLPLAGKSNEGVFRYGRDNRPDELWTCTENDSYPNHSCFNIWRSVSKLLLDFTNDWKAGKDMTQHEAYGLGSDYVDYLLPIPEEATVKLTINKEYEKEAMEKEKASSPALGAK